MDSNEIQAYFEMARVERLSIPLNGFIMNVEYKGTKYTFLSIPLNGFVSNCYPYWVWLFERPFQFH